MLGANYAGNLAKELHTRITLCFIQLSIWPEATQLAAETAESREALNDRLRQLAVHLQDEFGIPVDYRYLVSLDAVEQVIADLAGQYQLVVMGTNGLANYYKHVMGSRTFGVIARTRCPVLVIPEGVSYQPISRIVYAYDPETNPIFLIDQLKRLAAELHLEVTVLHVSPHKPAPETEHQVELLRLAIQARQPSSLVFHFAHRFGNDISDTLHQFMMEQPGSLLAMSFHRHTFMEQLFRKDVIAGVSSLASYPVYVFWR